MIIFYVVAASTVFVMGGSTYFALNMASKDPMLTSVANRSKIMESLMLDDASLDEKQSGGGLRGPNPGESGPVAAVVPMLAKLYRAVIFDRHGIISPQQEMIVALVVRITVPDRLFFAYLVDTLVSVTTGVARFPHGETPDARRRRAFAMLIPWYTAAYALP